MNKAALFSLSALVAIACAAPTSPSDEPTYGDGDGDGNQMGSGGAGTGGFVVGTSGGAPPVGSGGAPPVGSGGAPPVGSGGAPPVGSGGAPPIGATCSATGFVISNGYADNGTMCGYAWTTGWDGATVVPSCDGTANSCFEAGGATLCATGTIPAEGAVYPGMMIGWNAQQNDMGGANATWTASGAGLTANFTATGATGQTRIVIQSGATDYCANATSGMAIPWSGFTVGCWEAGGAAFSAGMPVTAVGIQVNSAMAEQTVDLCVTGITVN